MRGHNALTDVQTQPAAFELTNPCRTVEPLEDMRRFSRAQPDAMIAQTDGHVAFVGTDTEGNLAAVGRILHGIYEQVTDNLLQSALVPAPRDLRRRAQREMMPLGRDL